MLVSGVIALQINDVLWPRTLETDIIVAPLVLLSSFLAGWLTCGAAFYPTADWSGPSSWTMYATLICYHMVQCALLVVFLAASRRVVKRPFLRYVISISALLILWLLIPDGPRYKFLFFIGAVK
jgi:hypothetical protein